MSSKTFYTCEKCCRRIHEDSVVMKRYPNSGMLEDVLAKMDRKSGRKPPKEMAFHTMKEWKSTKMASWPVIGCSGQMVTYDCGPLHEETDQEYYLFISGCTPV